MAERRTVASRSAAPPPTGRSVSTTTSGSSGRPGWPSCSIDAAPAATSRRCIPRRGTFIEADWEIDRALELTEVGLCLETGHQMVGGGSALATLERWGDRINHVHVKDASAAVIDRIVGDSMAVEAIWQERAFVALGAGDVPVADILARLTAMDYSGWMVVEQDIFPGPGDPGNAQRDQVANRALLRDERLLTAELAGHRRSSPAQRPTVDHGLAVRPRSVLHDDRMPSLDDFARVPLLFGPSPIHPLPRLSAALGGKVEIWAKREDCNSGIALRRQQGPQARVPGR